MSSKEQLDPYHIQKALGADDPIPVPSLDSPLAAIGLGKMFSRTLRSHAIQASPARDETSEAPSAELDQQLDSGKGKLL